jgi:hypothetical protein
LIHTRWRIPFTTVILIVMAYRRPTWRDIVFPLVVGLFSLAIVVRRPRFAVIHTVDALELVAAGVMFGLALRAFAMWMHDRLKPQ